MDNTSTFSSSSNSSQAEEHLLWIEPWSKSSLDLVGVDPRSTYVELFWLGILGPSTTLLLRLLARRFDSAPHGFVLDISQTANQLGVGHRSGKHSPLARALSRAEQFGMANTTAPCTIEVRQKIPYLSARQVGILPDELRTLHDEMVRADSSGAALGMDQRARRLALSLVQLGEDTIATERQLVAWRFDPTTAARASQWAAAQGHPKNVQS